MNGVIQYLKVEYLICFQMVCALACLFLDFDHFVIKIFSAYKDLSVLKFESKDFIFFFVGAIELLYKEP